MVKKSLVALVVAVGLLAAFVATRPDQYRVVRSVTVFAPAAIAYGHVANFHRWSAWSPWGTIDPRIKVEYGGPVAGTGATYRWTGNDRLGEGRMTIVAAKPAAELVISLERPRRWEDGSTVTFAFAPEGAGTRVSWEMAGRLGFVGKALGLFGDADRTVGPDFEAGLSALKGIAECEGWEAGTGSAVSESIPEGALSAVVERPSK